MAQLALVRAEIPTVSPQLAFAGPPGPAGPKLAARHMACLFAGATGREATRGDGRVVVELECGVPVYPAREPGDRWRAVWYENGLRRQCEARSEERLAERLEKVAERLTADAPNLERPGADLIASYLSADRLPAQPAVVAQACPYPGPCLCHETTRLASPQLPGALTVRKSAERSAFYLDVSLDIPFLSGLPVSPRPGNARNVCELSPDSGVLLLRLLPGICCKSIVWPPRPVASPDGARLRPLASGNCAIGPSGTVRHFFVIVRVALS